MENSRKTLRGITGAALVLLLGLGAVNCGGSKNGNPAPGNTAGSGGGGGGHAGGSAGSSGGGGGGTSGADAGTCDPSTFPQDAGCMPCATNPEFGCATVTTTCIHFDNSTIPANVPKL